MAAKCLDLMFADSVRRVQQESCGHAVMITGAPERDPLGVAETEFIAARDSFYIGTVSGNGWSGWPYVQHRGGPPGFLRVLDSSTLVFADYRGSRQLLATGNLAVNNRVALFLMDYLNGERLKVLGHARVVDSRTHPELLMQVTPSETKGNVEWVMVIDVVSFDWNCTKYIAPRYSVGEVEALATSLKARIVELEAELRAVKLEAGLI
ncbi:MAG: pyridoxamine 5'-phosphate oxidase family protein [Nitrospira sp.]|nr:pyridoxamine 5'-phosphate oxidase family protein [Nitrospira sp.]